MNVTDIRFPWRDERRRMRPGEVRSDSLDTKIDQAVRLVMTQDPSPQAYPAVLDAVRKAASARSEPETALPWVVALSASIATLLLAAVALQTFGPAVEQVQVGIGSRFLIQLSDTRFAHWINETESLFGYAGFLFLHTFGLAIVVGISIAVDLRLLGFAPRVPISSVRTLFPPMWVGFWMSAVSGAILFMADATRKAENPLFEIKLALVALGVMVMALIYRQIAAMDRHQTDTSSVRGRLLAIASLLIWLGAIAAGRLVAYV
jgi:hypothetical protein